MRGGAQEFAYENFFLKNLLGDSEAGPDWKILGLGEMVGCRLGASRGQSRSPTCAHHGQAGSPHTDGSLLGMPGSMGSPWGHKGDGHSCKAHFTPFPSHWPTAKVLGWWEPKRPSSTRTSPLTQRLCPRTGSEKVTVNSVRRPSPFIEEAFTAFRKTPVCGMSELS